MTVIFLKDIKRSLPGGDELVEKKLLLGVLADAMDSLLPEERELAMKGFGEDRSLLPCRFGRLRNIPSYLS